MSRKFKVPVGLVVLSTPPDTPTVGDLYLNSSLGIMIYTDSGWQKSNTPEQIDGQLQTYWSNETTGGAFVYAGGSSPTAIASQTLDGGNP